MEILRAAEAAEPWKALGAHLDGIAEADAEQSLAALAFYVDPMVEVQRALLDLLAGQGSGAPDRLPFRSLAVGQVEAVLVEGDGVVENMKKETRHNAAPLRPAAPVRLILCQAPHDSPSI